MTYSFSGVLCALVRHHPDINMHNLIYIVGRKISDLHLPYFNNWYVTIKIISWQYI